jgi:uncharacterized protein (DUF1800 family)
MAASAVRALDAEVEFASAIAQKLTELGQPLYRKAEPTGYSIRNEDWVNSAALLGRMNFALALTDGKVPGVRPRISGSRQELEARLLPAGLSAATREVLENALRQQETKPDRIVGLLLGSPEFQRK